MRSLSPVAKPGVPSRRSGGIPAIHQGIVLCRFSRCMEYRSSADWGMHPLGFLTSLSPVAKPGVPSRRSGGIPANRQCIVLCRFSRCMESRRYLSWDTDALRKRTSFHHSMGMHPFISSPPLAQCIQKKSLMHRPVARVHRSLYLFQNN